jgi:RNA polymerase sigma factor (sigma-70 family)
MKEQLVQSNRWSMTQEAFDALLVWLHSDREQAGEIYEKIRIKLIRLFELKGCLYPEEYADETIQRVARKVSEGIKFNPNDPFSYFRGVARNALSEYWRSKNIESVDELLPNAHPKVDPIDKERQKQIQTEKERALECLEHCIQSLPPETRNLFIEYHRDERRDRIDGRVSLAKQIGIDISALRNRITRIREKLEGCIGDCARL